MAGWLSAMLLITVAAVVHVVVAIAVLVLAILSMVKGHHYLWDQARVAHREDGQYYGVHTQIIAIHAHIYMYM